MTPSYFSAYVPSLRRLQYTTPHFNCISTIRSKVSFFVQSISYELTTVELICIKLFGHTVDDKIVTVVLYVFNRLSYIAYLGEAVNISLFSLSKKFCYCGDRK